MEPQELEQPTSDPLDFLNASAPAGVWGTFRSTPAASTQPEQSYREWHKHGADVRFALGQVQFVEVEPSLWVANLIGQQGIRPANGVPPIRYEAVRGGLRRVAEFAQTKAASIHMPRIGCGLAGGTWDEVGRLVQEELADKEIVVYVYDFQ
jgi:O-acetyl-ADP-ribose deacetylase (regulator of RNase III)